MALGLFGSSSPRSTVLGIHLGGKEGHHQRLVVSLTEYRRRYPGAVKNLERHFVILLTTQVRIGKDRSIPLEWIKLPSFHE